MKKTNRLASAPAISCPCGSGVVYLQCCAPYHHAAPVPTAEKLMRARYTAYVLKDNAFIAATWHPTTRPVALDSTTSTDPEARWLGLEIRHAAESGDEATVEFVARYKLEGRARRLHEISRFLREGGLWWYLDGRFPEEEKQ